MKTLLFVCLLVLIAPNAASTSAGNPSSLGTQSKEADDSQPGATHARLVARAGDYVTTIRFRPSPDAKPIETTGAAKLTSILGGRFLAEENSGVQFGTPFNGMRLTGYNTAAKKYEASWVYTGSAAILNLSGTSSNEGMTINWEGSYMTGADSKLTIRGRTRNIDADRFVLELFGKAPNGTEFTLLETTYVRKRQ